MLFFVFLPDIVRVTDEADVAELQSIAMFLLLIFFFALEETLSAFN